MDRNQSMSSLANYINESVLVTLCTENQIAVGFDRVMQSNALRMSI